MTPPPDASADTFQARFERRWGHLTRSHVRALAWLLDAPDLLDPASPHWRGQIATLGAVTPAIADWLAALDADPAPLDAALGQRTYTRLGLYAEKLMAFYFQQHGMLAAHGLQVRANRNDTVGEFDFLLRDGGRLLHWELATKFYLFDGAPPLDVDDGSFNCLIGPNLADTLGAKMRKILDKQLALASHPAAQALLPRPVDCAQALVKGWLFYPDGVWCALDGISQPHCHGFWFTLTESVALEGENFILMPRLEWLAPMKAPLATAPVLDRAELRQVLERHMATVATPRMVALVARHEDWWVERARGFVVPDDWRAQAATRRLAGTLPS